MGNRTEKLKNLILVKISEVNIVPGNLVFQFFSFAHFIDQFLALEKYVPKYVEFTDCK